MPKDKTTNTNTDNKANEPHSTEEVIEPKETTDNKVEDMGNASYGVWNKPKVKKGDEGTYTLKDDKDAQPYFKKKKEDVIEIDLSGIFKSDSKSESESRSKSKSTSTESDSEWFKKTIDKSADYIDTSLEERPSLIKNTWALTKNIVKLGLSAVGTVGVGLAVTNKAFGDTELGKTVEGEITLFNALSSKSSAKVVKATGRDVKELYDYAKGKFDD